MLRNPRGAMQIVAVVAFLVVGSAAWAQDSGSGGIGRDPMIITVDLWPTICPNFFSPDEYRLQDPEFPAATLGGDGFDAHNVDTGTLLLTVPGGGGRLCQELVPLTTWTEDLAAPPAGGTLCECTEDGPDGYIDVGMLFDAYELAAALGNTYPGQFIPLVLTGQMNDGSPFTGIDCVLITGTVDNNRETWGAVKALYH